MTKRHRDGLRVCAARALRGRLLATMVGAAFLIAACGDGDNEQVESDTNRDESTGEDVSMTTSSAVLDGARAEDCSAEGLSPELPEQPLPVLVERTRQSIAAAAAACNFTTLAHIASEGDQPFTFSFGGGVDPAAHWREEEVSGDDVAARLLSLLRLPHVQTGEVFVWPSAYEENAPASAWEALESVYPDATIEQWRATGTYLGHRVGIAPNGEWLFYVAGD